MNILVLNGSPKGDYSCTLQTALYIEKLNPQHKFSYLNVGSRISEFEKDFNEAAGMIKTADLLLFCYPVYTFIVPSQLHRFVELMKERLLPEDISGKFASQLTTSKHFYDITAHNFILENCQDMGLKFVKGLSADMDDLTTKKGQEEASSFARYLFWNVENDVYESFPEKRQAPRHVKVELDNASTTRNSDADFSKSVALVADLAPDDRQLSDMISFFKACMSDCDIKFVNIHDFPFRGGCISCFNCAVDGSCIYKDGFSELLRENIQTCDAIVLAFSIKDHSMGSIFKTYDDRQFCNGHRTVTMGKPFGYLISGDYSLEKNLQMIVEGRAEVGGNFLAGVASDEFDPNSDIVSLAKRLKYAMKENYVQPANFLGVGGMKIFRDLIWLMQGMMKADHRFYKEHGMYDFPQKKRKTMMLMYLVGAMMGNQKLKAKMGNKMNEGMIAPYKKVLDKL